MVGYHDIKLVWDDMSRIYGGQADPPSGITVPPFQDTIDHYEVVRYGVSNPTVDLYDNVHFVGATKTPYITDKRVPESYDIPPTYFGGYFYLVWAVDKAGRYSANPAEIYKTSPQDYYSTPPTPTGLQGKRNISLTTVELNWNEVGTIANKGFLVERALDYDKDNPPADWAGWEALDWQIIGFPASNKFTDSDIPLGYSPIHQAYWMTWAVYRVSQVDQYHNVSAPSYFLNELLAPEVFELTLFDGMRFNLDYLSIMIRWNEIVEEMATRNDGAVIHDLSIIGALIRYYGDPNWYPIGSCTYPTNQIYYEGPLEKNKIYDIRLGILQEPELAIMNVYSQTVPNEVFSIDAAGEYHDTDDTDYPFGLSTAALFDGCINTGNDGIHRVRRYGSNHYDNEDNDFVATQPTQQGTITMASHVKISGSNLTSIWNIGDIVEISGSDYNDGFYYIFNNDFQDSHGWGLGTILSLFPQLIAGGNLGYIRLWSSATLQPRIIRVVTPDYEEDITPPTPPALPSTTKDPDNDRIFLTWSRQLIDDDFYSYEVYIREDSVAQSGPADKWGSTRPYVLYGKTSDNNMTINNISPRLDRQLYSINSLNYTSKYISLASGDGDVTRAFQDGDIIEIRGCSAGNNNRKVIVTSSTYTTYTTIYYDEYTDEYGFSYGLPTANATDGILGKPREIAFEIVAIDRAGNPSTVVQIKDEWRSQEFEGLFHNGTYYGCHRNFNYLPHMVRSLEIAATPAASIDRRTWWWDDVAKLAEYFDKYIALYFVSDEKTAFDSFYAAFGQGYIANDEVFVTQFVNETDRYTLAGVGSQYVYVWIWAVDKFGNIYSMDATHAGATGPNVTLGNNVS